MLSDADADGELDDLHDAPFVTESINNNNNQDENSNEDDIDDRLSHNNDSINKNDNTTDNNHLVDYHHHHNYQQQRPEQQIRLTIRVPPKQMARSVDGHEGPARRLRSSTLKTPDSAAGPSGSEYSAGDASSSSPVTRSASKKKQIVYKDDDEEYDVEEKAEVEYTTVHGRQTKRKCYVESDDDALDLFHTDENVDVVAHEEKKPPRPNGRITTRLSGRRTVNSDDEGGVALSRYSTRSRSKKESESPPQATNTNANALEHEPTEVTGGGRITRAASRRLTRKSAQQVEDETNYEDLNSHDAPGSSEDEMMDDDVHTTPSPEPEGEMEDDTEPKQYRLRTRKNINYAIPPPLEEMPPPPAKNKQRPNKGKGRAGPGWSANGTMLSKYMGMPIPGDDSDSDVPSRTPRKPMGAGTGAGGGLFAAGGGGLFQDGLAAGTPSNLGKVTDAALADADPLGVNPNVTFDEVGGLDDHINSLKEMTLLPLLYPELFQRFNLTPPRGVLFHGPPGTGKTLLARALAASCRSNGKGISFFMRKGADCLSKWVGEAERQLRLLFEEARNQQPSIIFFDEIDGLAPVRSSKQDQIHASIVSTLLALMDGMDGRGQVIVIGATNRPDAVDPALRRPGRFDREFYFPLPNGKAREKILGIITRKWEGWGEGKAQETIERLAKLTKGYGGADLRALCTEAALNAIQRRYPQIYKSNDRLLLKPETIGVQARDFMISVKKLVPSSARSTSSAATPLPSQLVPLLEESLQKAISVLEKAMPLGKKRTALEEAEFEDEGDEGALSREMLMQKMESLRVYRPRVVLHGDVGMGQSYVGPALLHHLEGFHVQTLDLGSLMGDSTRTVEAGIVQLFVEAKRHQPSIVYIPSLLSWCAAVTETARTTVKAMLDTLASSDPILLLAVVDGRFSNLPRDVRLWFGGGGTKENRVLFTHPDGEKRRQFFDELLADVRRPPTAFPDGVQRRKRVLEELPIAPPIEPRKPTPAELAVQVENDQKVLTLLKFRLGPILAELKRKHKRFTKPAREEYNLYPENTWDVFFTGQGLQPVADPAPTLPNGHINGVVSDQPEIHLNGGPALTRPEEPQLFEVDLESINVDLYKGKYLTPNMFLDEIGKIVFNAEVRAEEDRDRLNKAQAMYTAAQVSIQEFDPGFRLECERMAEREIQRREQRRAEKEKQRSRQASREGSANGNGNGSGLENGNGAPVRRSGRNNGQAPELGITDPLLIERRLKRQRPDGTTIASGEESGEDHHHASGNNNNNKRSRMDVDTEEPQTQSQQQQQALTSLGLEARQHDERDELDVLGPTSSQVRPTVVRFAAAADDANSVLETPTRGSSINGHHHPLHPLHYHPSSTTSQRPFLTPIAELGHGEGRHNLALSEMLNPSTPTRAHALPSVQSLIASGGMNMGVDMDMDRMSMTPQTPLPMSRLQAFDTTHPTSPFVDTPSHAQAQSDPATRFQPLMPIQSLPGLVNNSIFNDKEDKEKREIVAAPGVGGDPSALRTPRRSRSPALAPAPPSAARQPVDASLVSTLVDAKEKESESADPVHTNINAQVAASIHVSSRAATPMEIESDHTAASKPAEAADVIPRSPSPAPPLPDFHVDEQLLSDLETRFVAETEQLNVEELEQLRAAALNCIWRHRQAWDRDPCVKELVGIVDEFVQEAVLGEED